MKNKQSSPAMLKRKKQSLPGKLLIFGILLWVSIAAMTDSSGAATIISKNLVFVKGGTFQMGEGEKKHDVTLSDYYICKYDVTYSDFKAFVDYTGYQTMAEIFGKAWWYDTKKNEITYKIGASWKDTGFLQTGNHPVVSISWYDSIKYCNWKSKHDGSQPVYQINEKAKDPNNLSDDEVDPFRWIVAVDWKANGYRLPTEAEWQFAAQSRGKEVKYSWGNAAIPAIKGLKCANVADKTFKGKFFQKKIFEKYRDGYIFTSPVDKFKPNELGLYDMTGNVWDWCWDWYGDYQKEDRINPKGVLKGNTRVARGGSWYNDPICANVTHRVYSDPWTHSGDVGFRMVRTY